MKVLSLLSSGIDSPVASYLISKHYEIIAIHFSHQPYITIKQEEIVKKLCKQLKIKKLIVIPFGIIQKEIIKDCNSRYRCIICRRLMFRIAEKIAKKEKCKFLLTGENLSQVASQVLPNLVNTQKAVKITILKPLLCFDKQEIINIAREIGTYEISIQTPGCCGVVPKFPTTRSKLDIIKHQEKQLKITTLVSKAVKNAQIEDLS